MNHFTRRTSIRRRCGVAIILVAAFSAGLAFGAPGAAGAPSGPSLTAAQKSTLDRFLAALSGGRYPAAFALLTADERRYFGSAANYASIFAADRLTVGHTALTRVLPAPPRGVVAVVSEDVAFFDHAKQADATATVRVPYGLLDEAGGVRVKDPYHPWRAVVPQAARADVDKLRVVVRKVSFFTGHVELVVSFANLGDETVTLLPYGRSVLRDDAGHVYHLVETKIPALTDRSLRLGLRLAPIAQYTGVLTFFSPDRFTPKTLELTVAPSLRDGADAPFDVVLPVIDISA